MPRKLANNTLNSDNQIVNNLPKKFDLSHLDPNYLALVYNVISKKPFRLSNFKKTVLNNLLDLTIHQAIDQSEFYSSLYGDQATGKYIGKNELKKYPILDRETLEKNSDSMKSKYANYEFSTYTGGTTNSNPITIDRSKEEQRYLIQFFNILNSLEKTTDFKRLVLLFSTTAHGNKIKIPSKTYQFPIDISKTAGMNQALKLLKKEITISNETKKIEYLSGAYTNIILFTLFIMNDRQNTFTGQIKHIYASGAYQSSYSRQWLTEFWGCDIENNYSLAELFHKAFYCNRCGHFHFDPFGISEIVELGTNKPIDNGRGKLLLTGLFPFTQMTPLIRYYPGDLVEKKNVNCELDSEGYTFLGREKNSLNLQQELGVGFFLGNNEVFELLDPIPEVGRISIEHFCYNTVNSVSIKPKFCLTRNSNNKPTIAIELVYSPHYFPERTRQLKFDIIKKIKNLNNKLDEQIARNSLLIDFYSPNTLSLRDDQQKIFLQPAFT